MIKGKRWGKGRGKAQGKGRGGGLRRNIYNFFFSFFNSRGPHKIEDVFFVFFFGGGDITYSSHTFHSYQARRKDGGEGERKRGGLFRL